MATVTTPSHPAVPDRLVQRDDDRVGRGDLGWRDNPAPASCVRVIEQPRWRPTSILADAATSAINSNDFLVALVGLER
jgi:hypothetical protein